MTDTTTTTVAKDDTAILAAWGRRSVASAIYSGLPFSECPNAAYTPEEREQVDVMDAAEIAICEATATTARGVEIQLWTALAHIEQDRDAESAINIMDLDWFLMDEGRFDWNVRLLLSALRSLRAIGGCGMKRDLPMKLCGAWPTLAHNYALARAELALSDALGSEDGEAKNDAYTAAVDAILLTPAECAADIRLKIEVMTQHNIVDGWWCAEEAMAMVAIDARGLLPVLREGVRS